MKLVVLTIHNRYQQPGGEDLVFASEASLLERRGHRVIRYEEDNARIGSGAAAAVDAVWSSRSAKAIGELARLHKPDVAHFHNTFPLISPAAYYAVQNEGVPVVQTLHNFRLICPGATLFREGRVCEECVERRSARPAVEHGCYRGSRPATAAVAAMLTIHGAAGTWRRKVDRYIALTEFARAKFIAGGLPASRIAVKPNFVDLDAPRRADAGYALFAGRLSAEKGIATMAEAWTRLSGIPLVVAGDGPMAGSLPAHETGREPRETVLERMREARALIFPSLCYEGAPMTIAEAFACGLPVIASRLGAMAETVRDGETGLLFRAGDAADLAEKVRWAFAHPGEMAAMGAAARREYEAKYSPQPNYEMLLAIYRSAIDSRRREARAAS